MAISHRCSNNIVSSDIRRMFEGKWNWFWLSRVIPLVDIRRYPDLPWNRAGLSENSTLTVDDIEHLPVKDGKWDWFAISSKIQVSEVRKNPNLPWDRRGLSYNRTLRVDDIEHLPVKEGKWDWFAISERMPLSEVRKNPNLPWDKSALSYNSTLTADDAEYLQIEDRRWYLTHEDDLSSTIPLSEIRESLYLTWNMDELSRNPTLTADDILYLADVGFMEIDEWNWDDVSSVIPIIDVYMYPDLPWNRGGLSQNKNIRVSDLIAWQEISPSIYKRWQYPTDVVIV